MREGYRLDEVCDFINGGSWTANEYSNECYPVLKVSNFQQDSFDLEDVSFLDAKYITKYKKHELKLHDVVVATVGSHPNLVNSSAGRCVCIPQKIVGYLLNQNAVCLRTKNDKVLDQRYFAYLCKTQIFQHYIQQRGKGAANQMRIPIGGIKSFRYKFPKIKNQRKIASILSAYDDLIENNLRRIQLLEELAQQTYEEWFVRMRFPGHETAEWDEEIGLPKGWEKVKCYDIMDVMSGGTPKTTENQYWNGEIQFFTPKDVSNSSYTNGTMKRITTLGLSKCNSKLYPKNTVFITARGTVGKINLASESMAMNQSCYALRGKKEINQYFLFESIKNIVYSFKSVASGGVFDTIVVDTFKFLPFLKPTSSLINEFTDFVSPLYQKSLILQTQNRLLKEARDILLPRLMMGLIDVESIHIPENGMLEITNE